MMWGWILGLTLTRSRRYRALRPRVERRSNADAGGRLIPYPAQWAYDMPMPRDNAGGRAQFILQGEKWTLKRRYPHFWRMCPRIGNLKSHFCVFLDTLVAAKCDLLKDRNGKAHHTDDYETVNSRLVVRRGQVFYLRVTFNRDTNFPADQLRFELHMGWYISSIYIMLMGLGCLSSRA